MGISLDELNWEKRVAAGGQGRKDTGKLAGGETGLASLLNKDISFGGGFTDLRKEKMYADIELLLNAGLDLSMIFGLLIAESTNKKEKEIYNRIQRDLVRGKSFSASLQENKEFSQYEYISIQMGEESGKLPMVCKELARFYAGKIRQRKQIKSALIYPCLVLGTAVLVLAFMLKFVVPMFVQIFSQNKVELPAITRFIIRVSDNFSVFLYSVFFLIAGFMIVRFTQKRKDWYRNLSAHILLRTPFFGPLYHSIYLARLCYSMQLLLSSKALLTDALELVSRMAGFYPIEHSLTGIKADIVKGKSLNESMSRFSVYPGRMVSLLKVGEEVNQLEKVFGKLGQQYADDAEMKTKSLNSVLEPLLILFIGAIVGFILVAMYVPMFQIGNAIGG